MPPSLFWGRPRRVAAGAPLAFALLLLFGAGLLALPLLGLGRVALATSEGLSLAPIAEALGKRSVQRALWNSLESSLASAGLALCLGTATALIVGLTDVRRKGLFTFLLMIPMMVPPHVTAIAWIQTMGPSSPLLRSFGLAPAVGSTHPLYSAGGVIFLLALQNTPLVFLVILAALRALPREVSEAARVAGAGPARMLWRIVLPLLRPALIAAGALAFVAALGNFGIPALLGIPARYTTLPVLMWQRLASFGPTVLADMAVIACLLALIAALAVAAQLFLLRRAGAALIGPPQPALHLRLGAARGWVEAALALLLLTTLVLPLLALTATALVRTYGLALTAETLTVSNFVEVLFRQGVTLRAFFNSTLVAGGAALSLALCGLLIAHFLARRERIYRRGAGGLATLAEIGFSVPGLVISVAFILAFIRPLPVIGVSIYNTLGIIFLAYLAAFLAVALKPLISARRQLDPSLDEAARVAGAGFWRRIGRIEAPLLAPAAASGAILVFMTAYNEVTVSALLWSAGNETIGTVIFNYEDGGYTTLAAAMSALTVAATVALMLGLDRLGRRAPPGVVPWRL